MANYIVGDIQGCLKPLRCLLEQVQFDPHRDHLWSVGDIINRGPDSLATLRFLKSLGEHFHMVLGNHDLHFLAVAYGTATPKKGDTLDDILRAPDRDELVSWLCHQPLLIETENYILVHAGIPHLWTLAQARKLAREVEAALSGNHIRTYLESMYGNEPALWCDTLDGGARWRVITNYFTRMRVCTQQGSLDLSFKGPADEIPAGCRPWFEFHSPHSLESKPLFFGHWAALEAKTYGERFHALDSGCVWGNRLTLYHAEEHKRITCSCSST